MFLRACCEARANSELQPQRCRLQGSALNIRRLCVCVLPLCIISTNNSSRFVATICNYLAMIIVFALKTCIFCTVTSKWQWTLGNLFKALDQNCCPYHVSYDSSLHELQMAFPSTLLCRSPRFFWSGRTALAVWAACHIAARKIPAAVLMPMVPVRDLDVLSVGGKPNNTMSAGCYHSCSALLSSVPGTAITEWPSIPQTLQFLIQTVCDAEVWLQDQLQGLQLHLARRQRRLCDSWEFHCRRYICPCTSVSTTRWGSLCPLRKLKGS